MKHPSYWQRHNLDILILKQILQYTYPSGHFCLMRDLRQPSFNQVSHRFINNTITKIHTKPLIIFPKQFCHPHTNTVVLCQYKSYSARTWTAPITMVNQPNADATTLPLPSASAYPTGMLNESFFSHTLVANRETKGMKGPFKITFFISFGFCPRLPSLATLTQSANIAHLKAPSTKTDTPILFPKTTPLTISSKLLLAFPMLYCQLSSFPHGMQESDILAHITIG